MSAKDINWSGIDESGDEDFYSDYLDSVTATTGVRKLKQESYRFLRPKIGSKILDVGCGNGDDVRAIARIVGPTGHVVGIDNSSSLIEKATQREENEALSVEFLSEDVHRLPFENASFDGCRSDRVFMHLSDRRKALAEMIRVTRPGGWVVVNDPDWATLIISGPDKDLIRTVLGYGPYFPLNPWSGRELFGLFKATDLVNVEVVGSVAFVTTDYEVAKQMFQLEEVASTLLEAGIFDQGDANRWVNSLRQSAEAGSFFSSVSGFTVAGRKPIVG